MNHLIVIIATALFCVAVPARAQTSIKAASIYDQDGITVVSPNQPGWILLKTGKSETVFEKRDESGIFNASVKIIRTKTFETEKDRLTGWEALKQEEFSKLKQDHLHFNYTRFKVPFRSLLLPISAARTPQLRSVGSGSAFFPQALSS